MTHTTSDPGDGRTEEQYTADVAAVTLHRLKALAAELGHLQAEFEQLDGWAGDMTRMDAQPGPAALLGGLARAIGDIIHRAPEAVRDIAATLPIRGLDYEIPSPAAIAADLLASPDLLIKAYREALIFPAPPGK